VVLHCPNCGALITADNINIQQTLAVCSACHHVFDFSNSVLARKPKPRKLKPPARLHVHEDGSRFMLSYRFVFGPGATFGLVMTTLGAIGSALLFLNGHVNREPAPVVFILGLLTLGFWYLLAVFLTTTTRISLDDETLEVQSGPLPFPIRDDKILNTHDVARVVSEQLMETWPTGTTTHHVCAELHDGERIPLVTSLPRAHARYIVHALNAALHETDDLAVSESGDAVGDDTSRLAHLAADETTTTSASHH
jgi:hypothetical protein